MLNTLLNTLGTNIQFARQKAGISQAELADKIFVTQQAVSNWENGKKCPQIDNIVSICQVCDCSLNEILCEQSKWSHELTIDYTEAFLEALQKFDASDESADFKRWVHVITDKMLANKPLITKMCLTDFEYQTYLSLKNDMPYVSENDLNLKFYKLTAESCYKLTVFKKVLYMAESKLLFEKIKSNPIKKVYDELILEMVSFVPDDYVT